MQLELLKTADDAKTCAYLMANSEPWLTLKRDYQTCWQIFLDQTNELFVVKNNSDVAGFAVIKTNGFLSPYIQSICIAPAHCSKGVGTKILTELENKYAASHKHIFMCVSSFNGRAKELYLRNGYELVGELKDHIVDGHSEFILRKKLK